MSTLAMDAEAARIRDVVRQWAMEIQEREKSNGKS
jgi:hypothetical protein